MARISERTEAAAYRPAISWGAIFGGWLFAYGLAMLLYLFGAAVGLTSMAAMNDFSSGVAIGTAVWVLIAWAGSLFLGGLFAGRLAGRTDKGTGAMHGMIVWALSGLMTLLIGSMQIGGAIAAGTAVTKNVAQAGAAAGQAAGGANINIPGQITQNLRNQLSQQAGQAVAQTTDGQVTAQQAQQAIRNLDQQTLTNIGAALAAGNTQQARNILAQNTNLSQNEVNAIIQGVSQTLGTAGNQAQGFAAQAADQAGDFASTGLWVLFLSSLAGLAAASFGGTIGARRAARIYGVYGQPVADPHAYDPELSRHAV